MPKRSIAPLFGLAGICLMVGAQDLSASEEDKHEGGETETPLDLNNVDKDLVATIRKYVETNCFAVHEPTVMKLENGTLSYSRISCDKDVGLLSE